MPCNPETVIGEVLGRKASKGANPAALDFQCPYIQKRCPKRSTNLKEEPYPVCSLWRNPKKKPKAPNAPKTLKALKTPDIIKDRNPSEDLIFVCPKRFYAVDFLNDVIKHCWPGEKPLNPHVAPEVKMAGFGNVDFVIADVREDGEVNQFLSVELQAIDITGSVFGAYLSLREGIDLDKRPTYGFNWDNVYKRYVTQLIRKGYFHHHWKSKIVAVIPEQVYQHIIEQADFIRSPDVSSPNVNIIFMTYCLEEDPTRQDQYRPKLVRVEGTSHSGLVNAILYKEAPSKEVFCGQIKSSLVRAVNLADLIEAGQAPVDLEDHEGDL